MTNDFSEINTGMSGGDLPKAQQRRQRDGPRHECQPLIRHCTNHIIRSIKLRQLLQSNMPRAVQAMPKALKER